MATEVPGGWNLITDVIGAVISDGEKELELVTARETFESGETFEIAWEPDGTWRVVG